MKKFCLLITIGLLFALTAQGKENVKMYVETLPWEVNYNEAAIPPYTLPEVMRCQDGSEVKTVADWEKKRRPELLQLFKDVMYGEMLPMPDAVKYETIAAPVKVFGGLGFRREIRIIFQMKDGRSHDIVALLYTPAKAGKAPVFVGLTFGGNQIIDPDPAITMTGLRHPKAMRERGVHARRFPAEALLKRGYAMAVVSYNDIFPDMHDGWETSVFQLFYSKAELLARPKGVSSIGAWAWGMSRTLDYLETLPEIDAKNAAVFGHSRLGKAALWAGACDSRFKLACVNNSGCGGASLSRRLYGETLYSMFYRLKDATPERLARYIGRWWFTDTLVDKALKPQELPIDQHQLIALVAPRAVSVHSATKDQWADPKGEYLAAYHAGPVYSLYGKTPLKSAVPPPPETPVGTDVSYFLRTGVHDMLISDWNHYMDIADIVMKK